VGRGSTMVNRSLAACDQRWQQHESLIRSKYSTIFDVEEKRGLTCNILLLSVQRRRSDCLAPFQ
jgi:hypothetical protein